MFENSYNYIRPDHLELLSIESVAIAAMAACFLFHAYRRTASVELAYFMALPFSDGIFRVAFVQPSEIVAIILILTAGRRIRFTPVLLLASVFVLFSIIGYVNPTLASVNFDAVRDVSPGATSYGEWYSMLYSMKFVLVAMLFSVLVNKEFALPRGALRFVVLITFAVTFLQEILWTLGFQIPGVFYAGELIPRAEGLAHEPATWAIWVLSLFPYIFRFKLGRRFLLLNALTLVLTLSSFGLVSILLYLLLIVVLAPGRFVKRIRLIHALPILFLAGVLWSSWTALSGSEFLSKPLQYVGELAGSEHLDLSGRASDVAALKEYFPAHWLVGLGSFNTDRLDISDTNAYIGFLLGLGVLGSLLVAMCFALYYIDLFRKPRNVYFAAFCANYLMMIAGIRCLVFPDVWYAQANAFRTASAE